MLLPAKTTAGFDCVSFDAKSRCLIAGGGGDLEVEGSEDEESHRELAAWNLADGKLLWHTCEPADDSASSLVIRPGSNELATHAMSEMTVWSDRGKCLRTYDTDFLSGDIAYSSDGKLFVSPKGNKLKLRSADTGKEAATIELAKTIYTSGEAAAFLSQAKQLVVALSVINSKGQKSGKVQLVDYGKKQVLKSADIELIPDKVIVNPHGHWACLTGERKKRGGLVFWDLKNWTIIAEQNIDARITSLAVSPDGKQLALAGSDLVIRFWDAATGKATGQLEPGVIGSGSGGIAWSPDGNYLAFASSGKPPEGGVFLFRLTNGQWELIESNAEKQATAKAAAAPRPPIRVFGRGSDMDAKDWFPANPLPIKCATCTLPDVDAVPQPYVLVKGFAAAGDYSDAAMGNILVSARARQMFEVAVPGAVKFYPTVEAKTGKPTAWFLGVPQALASAYAVPDTTPRCPACGEPKLVDRSKPHPQIETTADVFKSKEWLCAKIGEDEPWFVKKELKGKIPPQQWTRLALGRHLWMSPRLLWLMRELNLKGMSYDLFLGNKPTPEEAAWVAEKMQQLQSAPAAKASTTKTLAAQKPAGKSSDVAKWFRAYLKAKTAAKPLATSDAVAAWEKKNGIKLPKAYGDFVTKIGRHSFPGVLEREGYSVRIVGPKGIDIKEYRRDVPTNGSDAGPDGLLFAVAINGDALCFDLRGAKQDYPVYHFDHETESFEPFADNFAAAVKRLDEKT
jgi:hypothetical protein